MATLADSLVSSASRTLPLRMRRDLSSRFHRYQGKPYWVVKEPIGLRYYRFQEEEYAILRMLDGTRSFQSIKDEFEKEFAPQKITLSDLQNFIGMLHRSGLLVADAVGQGKQLNKRRAEHSRREWMGKLSNILALRFKGIDPDRLLNFLHPVFGRFFSWPALICCSLLALSALSLIAAQFDSFRAGLPAFHEFFGPRNWVWLGVVLAVTKILHEFGHGLSCKHFGGECHEMGVMFLVLTPCLYCNVSDSWLLPNKWHRAAIGAAGMYVEMWLASIATFLWWYSEPGLLNHICLNVMFICSVSTLMFNGNPLLRFDGYYILSDIAEIPNLRQKASKILNLLLAKWCLGMELPDDPFLPERGRLLFGLYTIAAVIYRWVVVVSIMMFLNRVLEPYGLKVIGQTIAAAGVAGMLVQPAWQLWKFFSIPGRLHEVKRKNLLATIAILASAIALVFLIPMPYRVRCSVEIQPRDTKSVYVEVPGHVTKISVRSGDTIQQNDLLCVLENEDLELEIVALEGEIATTQQRINSQESQRGQHGPAFARDLKVLREQLASFTKLLNEKQEQRQRLTLYSPADGVVIPPKSRPEPKSEQLDGKLRSWAGTPLDEENQGLSLEKGDLVCRIGTAENMEAILVVDQTSIDFVRPGQTVWVCLEAYPDRIFESTVEVISREEIRDTSKGLSNQAGGELATRTDSGGRLRPLSTSYQAKAPISDPDHLLRPGQRGIAKIVAPPQTWGRRFLRYLAHTFHFQL